MMVDKPPNHSEYDVIALPPIQVFALGSASIMIIYDNKRLWLIPAFPKLSTSCLPDEAGFSLLRVASHKQATKNTMSRPPMLIKVCRYRSIAFRKRFMWDPWLDGFAELRRTG